MTQDTTLAEVREALRESAQGWGNLIDFAILPEDHQATAQGLFDQARLALAKLDAMPDRIAELEAEVMRLRENLRHSQGRFMNINIGLSSGGTKREAIEIADLGADCIKGYLSYQPIKGTIKP